jgi:hypothetical protein
VARSFGVKNNFKARFWHLEQDQFPNSSVAHRSSDEVFGGWRATMRWMIQRWIVPKEHETVYDVLLDATIALFSAAVATQVIQIIFSTL